jgi:protein SCO1/2
MRSLIGWAVPALFGAAAISGCGGNPPGAGATNVPGGGRPAAGFTLHDADGRSVRLSDLRGRPVLLTFVYTRCPDVCPLVLTNLVTGLERLGAAGRRARVIAVSVDPEGDSPRAVRQYLRVRGLEGRVTYLVGSRRELAPVWRAYGVSVRPTPRGWEIGHGATVHAITASGREQSVYGQNVSSQTIARDVPALAASSRDQARGSASIRSIHAIRRG